MTNSTAQTNRATRAGQATPNDKNRYEVSEDDLPLHCPLPSMSLWNSHPRVYLPIEATGEAKCPYCGAHFVLVNRKR